MESMERFLFYLSYVPTVVASVYNTDIQPPLVIRKEQRRSSHKVETHHGANLLPSDRGSTEYHLFNGALKDFIDLVKILELGMLSLDAEALTQP
jgi:hypothetical protein